MVIIKEKCDELSDKEIVSQSLDDMDYFLCLYERYESRLLRYVKRSIMVSDEQAKDILQEAFIKIWQNLHGFNQGIKLSSWIYRIVHNEAISYWRKKKSFGKDQKVKLNENLISDLPNEFDTEDDLELKELQTHEVLKLLPLKYKTILILKFIEGMSYQEISDVLKIPEGTVATRINRAKKRFVKIASDQHISFIVQN